MRKLIIFIIFLSILIGITGYYYYSKNLYSRDSLKLEILSSNQVQLGEEVEYIVKYKNNGNIRLEEPRLIFEYPKNSIVEGGGSLRQEIGAEKLGEAIYPGEEKIVRFKARLLGKEGEIKEAKAFLHYRPKGWTAYFESDTTFNTVIEKVPLVFQLDLPSKIGSEKEIQFRVNYSSNIDYPLSDLRCILDYPSGFEFSRSVPESIEQTEWDIPLLNRAKGGRIEVWGSLSGEVKEQKIFKATLGIWQSGEFIILKEITKGVEIVESSLYISQQINGNPEYIATPGDMLHYEISFRNIGEETMTDMAMIVKLEGEAFDLHSTKAPEGKFQLGDNSIVWDSRDIPKLRFLDENEEGKIEFWINLKDEWGVGSIQDKEPVVKSKVILSQARKEFTTKINSKLAISQKGYFNDDVFGNSGLIPPKIGDTTTYTIVWQVENRFNELKNVNVKATLPDNVDLTGKISPEEESSNFAFDSQSREIVWQIGDLEIGAGFFNQPKTCVFQVALTPTQDQKGKPAVLVNEVKVSGEDQWTEQIIDITAEAIDTTLPNDETINTEQGTIQ